MALLLLNVEKVSSRCFLRLNFGVDLDDCVTCEWVMRDVLRSFDKHLPGLLDKSGLQKLELVEI